MKEIVSLWLSSVKGKLIYLILSSVSLIYLILSSGSVQMRPTAVFRK